MPLRVLAERARDFDELAAAQEVRLATETSPMKPSAVE